MTSRADSRPLAGRDCSRVGCGTTSCLVLLPAGFTLPALLPEPRCALTAPFQPYLCRQVGRAGLPAIGGIFSVALSRSSRMVGITHHRALWSPDFPPPSLQIFNENPQKRQRSPGPLCLNRQSTANGLPTPTTAVFFRNSRNVAFSLLWLSHSKRSCRGKDPDAGSGNHELTLRIPVAKVKPNQVKSAREFCCCPACSGSSPTTNFLKTNR